MNLTETQQNILTWVTCNGANSNEDCFSALNDEFLLDDIVEGIRGDLTTLFDMNDLKAVSNHIEQQIMFEISLSQ